MKMSVGGANVVIEIADPHAIQPKRLTCIYKQRPFVIFSYDPFFSFLH